MKNIMKCHQVSSNICSLNRVCNRCFRMLPACSFSILHGCLAPGISGAGLGASTWSVSVQQLFQFHFFHPRPLRVSTLPATVDDWEVSPCFTHFITEPPFHATVNDAKGLKDAKSCEMRNQKLKTVRLCAYRQLSCEGQTRLQKLSWSSAYLD